MIQIEGPSAPARRRSLQISSTELARLQKDIVHILAGGVLKLSANSALTSDICSQQEGISS